MNVEKAQAGKNVMSFIRKFEKHGPRLPGSSAEQKAADALVKEIKLQTGVDAQKEEFTLRPRSGIGAIPYMGFLAYISLLIYFLGLVKGLESIFGIVSIVLMTCMWIFTILHILRYKTCFDFLFKKARSNNVIAELPARGGQAQDFTIIFSGHIDTSWNWPIAVKYPKLTIPAVGIGIVGALTFFIFILIKLIANLSFDEYPITKILPAICGLTFFPLCVFLSYNEKKASPGAMDNLSGLGLALEVFKFFKANPKAVPDDCRIIFAGMGAEEAGLRGSSAYVKRHLGHDDILVPGKTYVVNIDSIADKDHFEVVQGDLWQTAFFDKNMCDMAFAAMDEAGLKPKRILNPVGGCDSTPFHKAGIATCTLAAQCPTVSDYYHTYKDVSTRFGEDVLSDGFGVILRMTDKIIKQHKSRK